MATTTHPGNAPHTANSAADAEHSKLIASRNRLGNSGRVPNGAHTTVRPHSLRFVPGISRPPGHVPEDYWGVEDAGAGVPLAVAAIVGTVVGAYYYLKIVKVMYMDEAAPAFARVRQPVQGALIFLSALAVSPFGYLLIGPLQSLSDRAAVSIF